MNDTIITLQQEQEQLQAALVRMQRYSVTFTLNTNYQLCVISLTRIDNNENNLKRSRNSHRQGTKQGKWIVFMYEQADQCSLSFPLRSAEEEVKKTKESNRHIKEELSKCKNNMQYMKLQYTVSKG